MGLGVYLKTVQPVVESESNDWLATPEGKAFLKECAKLPAEAHTVSGEDRATAEAMAAKTAAFYCGEDQH